MLVLTSVGLPDLNTPKAFLSQAEGLGQDLLVGCCPVQRKRRTVEGHRKRPSSLDAFPQDFSAGLA